MAAGSPQLLNFEVLLKPCRAGGGVGLDMHQQGTERYTKLVVSRKEQEARERGTLADARPDWRAVAGLARDVLIHDAKDVEVACWLTHALTKHFGFPGLRDGIVLILALEERFGGDLHPTDLELHEARLSWLSQKPLLNAIRSTPLLQGPRGEAYTWHDWSQARKLSLTADPKIRKLAKEEGRIDLEAFDKAADETNPEFFEEVGADIDKTLESLGRLQNLVNERFPHEEDDPDDPVSFDPLIEALEGCLEFIDTRRQVPEPEEETYPDEGFMEIPSEGEPAETGDAVTPEPPVKEAQPKSEPDATSVSESRLDQDSRSEQPGDQRPAPRAQEVVSSSDAEAANLSTVAHHAPSLPSQKAEDPVLDEAQARKEDGGQSGTRETREASRPIDSTFERERTLDTGELDGVESDWAPRSLEDVPRVVGKLAQYIARTSPESPWAHSLLRAIRWSELRVSGQENLTSRLEPPRSDQRRRLKELFEQEQWQELRNAVLAAMAGPEGRAWLDLQFYLVQAVQHARGTEDPLVRLMERDLQRLLEDVPDLEQKELTDGTPCASVQTRAWIAQLSGAEVYPGQRMSAETVGKGKDPAVSPSPTDGKGPVAGREEGVLREPSSALERARKLLADGDFAGGLTVLRSDLDKATSGRERFLAHVSIAEYCLEGNEPSLARPLLEDLIAAVEHFNLEAWEKPQLLARVWGALIACSRALGDEKLFAGKSAPSAFDRLCRADIARAWALVGDGKGPA